MAKDLLFEIGMEEIPARFIRGAVEQLQGRMNNWLQEVRINYEQLDAYATPRRIAIIVKGLSEKQTDLQEEAKGPSKKIAIDIDGAWSKAALGFARSQGVEPEDLFFKELSGTEYVFALKNKMGIETQSLLGDALLGILHSMTFPKQMKWGNHEFKFVRPIRWITALYGDKVIPLEITNVKSSNISKGHRFLGNQKIEIPLAEHYADLLREQFVIVDMDERKNEIVKQIHLLSQEYDWTVSVNEDLLEEVLFLVEYPTVFFGNFDPDFLCIPQEVLITSMREHQRYFPVKNKSDDLLPYFVAVRNGNDTAIEQVTKGNEKVLRARLADARFFYNEDHKLSIEDALSKLEKIVFHEKLGTVADKVRRIRAISVQISNRLQLNPEEKNQIDRAAEICKFDLVTQMVYEFPELQGVMGQDYALKAKEELPVAHAVNEHYQPRFAGDNSPNSIIGAVVSMADKLDTIIGCFSIGIVPTGSQDPYALRRQAAGIVQILRDHRLKITLSQLIKISLDRYELPNLINRSITDIQNDLFDFFALRIKSVLLELVRYDVADAVMSSGFDDVTSVIQRAQALMNGLKHEDIKETIESFNRINNLASKSESNSTNPEFFSEQVEHELFRVWQDIEPIYMKQLSSGEELEAFISLSQLRKPITQYFETVMVMVEDEQIKQNRLSLLSSISLKIQKFANFQKLVW